VLAAAAAGLDGTGGDDVVHYRHAAYFAELVAPAAAGLVGPDQAQWLRRLDEEHDNVRAALHWATCREPELGPRIGAAMEKFWEIRGRLAEGRDLLERLLDCPAADQDPSERARVLWAAAHLAFLQADYTAARAQHRECL